MAPTPSLFHTLLRPSVLQILRAQGYHATRTAVVDSLTDLAARYLYALCQSTALNMGHNGADRPSIVDVRLALQECGVFLPEALFEEQEVAATGRRGCRGRLYALVPGSAEQGDQAHRAGR